MSGVRLRLLAGLLAGLAACHPWPGERDVIRRWLLCEECRSEELDAVVALGDNATGTLRTALQEGPSESGRKHIRRQAQARYARLRSPTVTLSRWLAHYDSSYAEHYQAHAATALGQIGTPAARAALLDAVQRDTAYGPDVLRALAAATRLALDTAAGAVQSAPRDSFVRVDPAVVVRDSTGQRLANVRVLFVVDSGGGQVTGSVGRTNANGLVSTRWALGHGPDSANVLRATVLRRSVTFRATGHGLRPRLVFAVQPSNGTRGQPMVPPAQVVALDAWDQRDTTINGLMQAFVIGTGIALTRPMVAGQADFANYVPLFSGTGLRLKVLMINTTAAVSQPFDVAP